MAEDSTQLPPEHTPLPGQTFGGTRHEESVKPETSSMKGKATAAMNDTKEAVKGLGEIFNRAKDGKIGEHKANTNEVLKNAKESLKVATESKVESHIASARAALDLYEGDRNTTFNKMNFVQRTAAQAGGNWGQAGKFEKGVRGVGTVVGLGAIISGTKNIVSPQKDENGQRKDSVWKQIGKIGVGAAAIYASLTSGGKNRAIGI